MKLSNYVLLIFIILFTKTQGGSLFLYVNWFINTHTKTKNIATPIVMYTL